MRLALVALNQSLVDITSLFRLWLLLIFTQVARRLEYSFNNNDSNN
jgi:hypothetical protein